MTEGSSASSGNEEAMSPEATAMAVGMSATPLGGAVGAVAGKMAADMQKMTADMNRVKQLADDKGFAVDENTGNALIKAAESYLKRWEGNKHDFQQLQDGLPLGRDSYAQQVSAFHGSKAAEAFNKLNMLERTLNSFVEAIRTAKRNYSEMEDHAALQFNSDDYV